MVISRQLLVGRTLQVYEGNCPPDKPCSPEATARLRQIFDNAPEEPSAADAEAAALRRGGFRCRHRGPDHRDPNGRAITRECKLG